LSLADQQKSLPTRRQNHELALRNLILLAFQKKRQQANLCDGLLNPTLPATTSATGVGAFNLPSKLVGRLPSNASSQKSPNRSPFHDTRRHSAHNHGAVDFLHEGGDSN